MPTAGARPDVPEEVHTLHWMKVFSCEMDLCGSARKAASMSMRVSAPHPRRPRGGREARAPAPRGAHVTAAALTSASTAKPLRGEVPRACDLRESHISPSLRANLAIANSHTTCH